MLTFNAVRLYKDDNKNDNNVEKCTPESKFWFIKIACMLAIK